MSKRSRMNGKTARMRKLPSQKDFEKWWANKAANAGDDRRYKEKLNEEYETDAMLDQARNYPDDFYQDYADFQNAGGIKRLENAQKHLEKSRYYSELANPAGKYNGRQRRTLRKLAANESRTSSQIHDTFNNKFGFEPSSSPASYEPSNHDLDGEWVARDPRDIMRYNANYSAYQNVRHKDPDWSYSHDVGPDYRIKDPYSSQEAGDNWVRLPGPQQFIRHDDSDNPVDDDNSDFNQEPEEDDYNDDEDEGEEE